MRSDLQALLNAPPVSNGHELRNKNMVLAWLLMKQYVPNVALNMPNVNSKVVGLQGVTPTNILDLSIGGLASAQGLSGNTWQQLKDAATAAINGQGTVSPTTGLQVNMGGQDFVTLQYYALLTIAKVLNDAS